MLEWIFYRALRKMPKSGEIKFKVVDAFVQEIIIKKYTVYSF